MYQVTPWHTVITFLAPESGIRSLSFTNQGNFWQQENFIVGSRLEHQMYWGADCCTSSVQVTVEDMQGEMVVCEAGMVLRSEENTMLIVAIGITSGLLVFVIIAASVMIIFIKRRREAQLQEMRNLPQYR